MAEGTGFYKKSKQAKYLYAQDKKSKIGIQLSDRAGKGHACFYWKKSKIVIHGRNRGDILEWLKPHTDVNPEPPRRRNNKGGGASGHQLDRPPPPAHL